ncbi:hypothetical protein [Mycetocola spongiae]|uniref:hypothetical protein n=1 Tax=Mycetocola spongiae TaxID=2859226 RepID=UPI001CF523C1|nr:hypothetical protein [Mycetocola spongiae]UCR88735.1 hypothetical protein KXZ72_12355 [Mycetocola spongiae]
MAFVLAVVLFLGGIYLFGLAFNLEEFQALVFFAGIIAVSVGVAIPTNMMRGR